MKVLVTLDFPPEIGGIQRYLFDIVRFTFSSHDRVLVGCTRRRPRCALNNVSTRMTWVSTPFSVWNKKWSCIPLFMHFIKLAAGKSDLHEISCGNVYAGIVPWVASFFMRVRYAVYTHGTEIFFLQKRTFRGWILKKILKRSCMLYSNSHFTASLLKKAGVSKDVVIIPPRVVIPFHRNCNATMKEKSEQTADVMIPHILCIGRLVPRKGFADALEAIALLPSNVQWHCTLVGDGPAAPQLRTICREKNILHRVDFKMDLSDEELSNEYDRAMMFVLPGSREGGVEGFGIVLIEAMAHKVPVIAGRTGGVVEVLDNGTCGILVEPGDVASLSREILRLLSDAGLRHRLADAAFERVKRQYAW